MTKNTISYIWAILSDINSDFDKNYNIYTQGQFLIIENWGKKAYFKTDRSNEVIEFVETLRDLHYNNNKNYLFNRLKDLY